MFVVQVTQYTPPNGDSRTGEVWLSADPERQRKYDELTKAGCNMTGEVRTPGAISDKYEVVTTISCKDVEDDFLTHITDHPMDGGPSGNDALEQAIDQWDREKFEAWKAAHEG